jgi:hypothetical protein
MIILPYIIYIYIYIYIFVWLHISGGIYEMEEVEVVTNDADSSNIVKYCFIDIMIGGKISITNCNFVNIWSDFSGAIIMNNNLNEEDEENEEEGEINIRIINSSFVNITV